MADIRTVGIRFDPKPAKKGIEEVKAAAGDMAASVDRDLEKVEASADSAGSAFTGAAARIERGAKNAENAAGRMARNTGGAFQRMATNVRSSAGSISNGIIDLLDTVGLLDNRFGGAVRRVQSGANSFRNLAGVFSGLRGAGQAAGAGATSAAAGMAEAASAASGAAGAAGAAAGGMSAMGVAAAVAIPLVVALAAALTGLGAAIGVFALLKAGIPKAADFESAETGFAVLLGSFDKAEEKMKGIAKFAADTPFESGQLIQGARYLETFTQGLLNNEKGWTLVGDAAAGAQREFSEVAMWVGRMYAGLKGGQPIGEATMRLMEMSLITPQVKGQLDALAESGNEGGKNFAEVWAIAEKSLLRFGGTMALQAGTWNGLVSTLKDNWGLLLKEFAAPVMDALKPALQFLIQLLDQARPYAAAVGQALADGITFAIELMRSGQLGEAFRLGMGAAIEWAWVLFQTLGAAYIVKVVEFWTNVFTTAVEAVVNFFATAFEVAVGLLTGTLEGDFGGAIAKVLQLFGDGGLGVVKYVGTAIYNAWGDSMERVVNAFYGGMMKVVGTIGKALAGMLDKASGIPLVGGTAGSSAAALRAGAAAATGAKLDIFTPIEQGGIGDLFGKASAGGPDAFRSDFAKMFGDLVQQGKDRMTKPALPAKPETPTETPTEGMGKGAAGDKPPRAKEVEEEISALQKLQAEWGNVEKQIDATAASAMQSIAGGMTNAIHGLIMGTKDAKTAFAEMATSIVSDIIRMILQMQIQLALAAALRAMGVSAPAAHSGGTMGSTPMGSTGTQMVLPTYHSGGMATSEQVVKVEKGESILTRRRAKEIEMELAAARDGGRQQRRGGDSSATIVNVLDRNEIADVLASRPDAVVNAISRQLPTVRKMVMTGNRP